MSDLLERVRTFADRDVDDEAAAWLRARASEAEAGDAAARAALDDAFQGPLEFGTAGLRGLVGPGETRMNRAVVIRATWGLVQHLLQVQPDAAARGVVIGRDGRRMSPELQRDAAEVIAALGVKVHWLEGTTPTPVAAFAVKHLGAAAGVVVTASHNPPAYNGYKVYWGNGAQIIPPIDAGIAGQIAVAPAARAVRRAPEAEARAAGLWVDAVVEDAYLDAIGKLAFTPDAPVGELVVAYSALHGVGERVLRRAFAARGIGKLHSVAEQAEPDGAFPTVSFPNPEEPGALDLVLALAGRVSADVVLVNDPDADRLGVAVRGADGAWAALSGNEIGVLLADHVMRHDAPGDANRLFVTTLVSSQMLAKMAADRGARYAETLTGFKWIANRAMALEAQDGLRFAFGYEEALGYTVGTVVRDKDGIGAALVMAELAAGLKARGQTLHDRLAELWRAHGFFVSRPKSLTLPGRDGIPKIKAAMARLRAAGLGAVPEATDLWDLEAGVRVYADGREVPVPGWSGDVLIYGLPGGGRASIRPSGTEPKLKMYLEVVEALGADEPVAQARVRADAKLDALLARLLAEADLA
ncbi:MAG: phospho-sugar mutase [Deltaproteobacteria bacterium]|nr:phospho-sugar mutase [Deltaproteobacteria bacterium]